MFLILLLDARNFKDKFDEAKGLVTRSQVQAKEKSKSASETIEKPEVESSSKEETATKDVTKELEGLSVKDSEKTE